MDMEIIDTVRADTLEVGDSILFYDEEGNSQVSVISLIEEDSDHPNQLNVDSEDDHQNVLIFDQMVNLYGYTTQEV